MFSWQDLDLNQPINWAHPLNRGRVAWWLVVPQRYGAPTWWDLASGYKGTLTSFASGYGWSTRSNPGGAGSIYGQASSTQVVNLPSAGALNFSTAGTLALWINGSGWSNNPLLISKESGTTDASAVYRWEFFSNALYLTLGDGNATSTQTSASWTPSNNVWYHLAVTWNGTTTTYYVNGKSIGSSSQGSYSTSNTAAAQIGNCTNKGSSNRSINGYCNDATFYKRGLSSAEISSLYWLSQQGYPGVLQWHDSDFIDLLLVSSPVGSMVPKPFVSRPRLEPAFFE